MVSPKIPQTIPPIIKAKVEVNPIHPEKVLLYPTGLNNTSNIPDQALNTPKNKILFTTSKPSSSNFTCLSTYF